MKRAIFIVIIVAGVCIIALLIIKGRGGREEEAPSPGKPVQTEVQREEKEKRFAETERLVEEWTRTGAESIYSSLDKESLPLLIEDYRSSSDEQEKLKIVDLLGIIGSDKAVAFLIEIARSSDPLFSVSAIGALSRSTNTQAIAAVAEFVGGSRPERIRWAATRMVAANGGVVLVQPLADIFHKGEPRTKIMAVYAMKGIYDRTDDEMLRKVLIEEALPVLSEMAETYLDPQIKRESWETLGYLNPGQALALYRQKGIRRPMVEERAVLSIGENGDEKVLHAAIALFDEADVDRKKVSACRIAGIIGRRQPSASTDTFLKERALPFLTSVAADENRDRRVRKLAIAALGESGDNGCIPLLQELARGYPRATNKAIEQIRARTGTR